MVTEMLVWGRGGVAAVTGGCEYMGGTRGSGIVSTDDDVIEMSVVRGVRGVGGVCERIIRFRLYQSCRNRGRVGRVSLLGFRWCGCFGRG